jgi:hypothetical protein
MLPEARVSLDRAEDKHERKAIEDIREHGVHVMHIFDDKGERPDFSYTVGLWHTHGQPEVFISGLKQSIRHTLLNNVNFRMGKGEQFANGQSYIDLIDGYRCYFQQFPTEQYRAYLGWDRWFYGGDNFEAVQMLWPSVDHIYPWEDGASEFLKNAQEVLTKIPLRVS